MPRIFVIGNEKGGAGKTTFSMHLIIGLLDRGYRVSSIDTDSRQQSLTTYLNNRQIYNQQNVKNKVTIPKHFHIKLVNNESLAKKKQQETELFKSAIESAKEDSDFIVIDTPGSHTYLSNMAHSYADTVITPINDSFVDLDVLAKIDNNNLDILAPSIYSQMLWEQKMERVARDQGSIDWVVVRNRMSSLNAQNKRNIEMVLSKLSKRIAFRIIPGFNERVIFRELFPYGLTLLDLKIANFVKSFSISHVAARQELRMFLESLSV